MAKVIDGQFDFFMLDKAQKRNRRTKKNRTDKYSRLVVVTPPNLGMLPFLFPEDYPEEYIEQLMAKENITWVDSDVELIQVELWKDALAVIKNSKSSVKVLDDIFAWIFLSEENDSDFSFCSVCSAVVDFPSDYVKMTIINQINALVYKANRGIIKKTKTHDFYSLILSKVGVNYDPDVKLNITEFNACY